MATFRIRVQATTDFICSSFFRPEGPGEKNAVTAVDAVGKTDDQTGDGAVRPMAARADSQVVAGDHGIPDVVTLLEKSY